MSKAVIQYHKQIHRELGAFATWLPGDRIEIGDVGVLVKGRFRRMGSLRELGIEVEVESSPVGHALRYSSTKGLDVSTRGKASARGAGALDISYGFSRAGACVFEADGVTHHRIRNRLAVGAAASEAHAAGRWDKTWHLIEELWTADCATILVAETKNSGLELSAEITSPAPGMLTNPEIGLRVSSRSGKVVEVVAARDVRPLYACSKIRGLGAGQLAPVRSEGEDADRSAVARTNLDELLDSMFEDD